MEKAQSFWQRRSWGVRGVHEFTRDLSKSIAFSRRKFLKTALATLGAAGMSLVGFNVAPVYAVNCSYCQSACTSCYVHVNCCSPNGVYCVSFDCSCPFGCGMPWCWWYFHGKVAICDDGSNPPLWEPQCIRDGC